MVDVGMPLKAGDVIMSGALGPMAPVAPGDAVEVRISGLGSSIPRLHSVFREKDL